MAMLGSLAYFYRVIDAAGNVALVEMPSERLVDLSLSRMSGNIRLVH